MIERTHSEIGMESGAVFSDCMLYRVSLWRKWAEGKRALLFAMNPSTATERDNDATIERWIRRVMHWNAAADFWGSKNLRFGSAEVVNAFGWRETYSGELVKCFKAGLDIIGPENDEHIRIALRRADFVLVGWGTPGTLGGRDAALLEIMRQEGKQPYCLGINDHGTPVHPLYQKYSTMPIPYPTYLEPQRP